MGVIRSPVIVVSFAFSHGVIQYVFKSCERLPLPVFGAIGNLIRQHLHTNQVMPTSPMISVIMIVFGSAMVMVMATGFEFDAILCLHQPSSSPSGNDMTKHQEKD